MGIRLNEFIAAQLEFKESPDLKRDREEMARLVIEYQKEQAHKRRINIVGKHFQEKPKKTWAK